jgi:hypothetical protein
LDEALDTLLELENRLAKLVAVVTGDRPSRLFSIAAFRRATAECLSEIREDSKKHGGTGEEPFWNLLMYDENPEGKALFVATVFVPQALRLYVGMGLPREVSRVCDRFSMAEVDGMERALRDGLHAADNVLHVPRGLAEYWLAGASA